MKWFNLVGKLSDPLVVAVVRWRYPNTGQLSVSAISKNISPPPPLKLGCGYILTRCGLVTPYGDIDLDQHWLWQCLDALWHQTIAWTIVDFSLVRFWGIRLRTLSQRLPKLIHCVMSLKVTLSKLLLHFPGNMSSKTLIWSSDWNDPGEIGEYQCCSCPGSLCHQVISNISIDHIPVTFTEKNYYCAYTSI